MDLPVGLLERLQPASKESRSRSSSADRDPGNIPALQFIRKSIPKNLPVQRQEEFSLPPPITTCQRLPTTPSRCSSSEATQGVTTHRLIGEGGGLGGGHVVIRRLERKLLHLLVLVEMNHLQETPRAQQHS